MKVVVTIGEQGTDEPLELWPVLREAVHLIGDAMGRTWRSGFWATPNGMSWTTMAVEDAFREAEEIVRAAKPHQG
jgi:hypothetical protein